MAPKKAEKTEAKPGYSDEGFTPRNADVLMTYRIEGIDDPQGVADYLWSHWRKGLPEHQADVGPAIENGAVIYTLHTIYRGSTQEEISRAELREGIKKTCHEDHIRVKMTHEPAPALPAAIPGIDAPAVLEVVGK
jgi:hypothetical protein